MQNKEKELLSLGSEFELISPAPAPAQNPVGPASGPTPVRKGLAGGSVGLLLALGGLLGAYPAKIAVVQAAAAAFLAFELLRSGLLRVQPASAPLAPIGGAVAVLAGVLGLAMGASEGIYTAPSIAILGGLYALAAAALAKKADAKLPPAPVQVPSDPQFSKLLLGNLLILGGTLLPWTDAARGVDTILGVILAACAVLGVCASWLGMSKTWAMPAVSGGLLGMSLIFVPLDGLLLGAFGLVRLVRGPMDLAPWPGSKELDFIQYGLPIVMVIAASVWCLTAVVQGTLKGVESQKKRKEEEVAARKAARSGKGSAS